MRVKSTCQAYKPNRLMEKVNSKRQIVWALF